MDEDTQAILKELDGYCTSAVRRTPGAAFYQFYKGNKLYNRQKYNEAIQCYDKAIKIDPGYTIAYFFIANSQK